MNSLKLIVAILCMVPLSVSGSGSPADITLGQFQTLKQKIANRSISQAEAQKTFTQLTNAIPPQKVNSYQTVIDQTINEAQKKGLALTIKGMPTSAKAPADTPAPIVAKPEKTPAATAQQELIPAQKVTTTTNPLQQKPTTIQTPASKVIAKPESTLLEAPKTIATSEPKTGVKPTAPLEQEPKTIEIPTLTDAQFNELKNKLKNLKKNHTLMSPGEIDATLSSIRTGFGNVPIPLYMQKIMARIEKFKTQLNNDLNTIATISNKLIDTKLPQIKNKLTDPKIIKNLALDAHMIEKEIEPFEVAYTTNNAIQSAALQATTKTIYDNLYIILQESMKQAAQLKDTALLNKLIRAYAFVAKEYPVYSAKRKERETQAKIQQELTLLEIQEKEKKDAAIRNKIAQIIQQLGTNNHYTRIEPEKVDEQLIVLEDNFDLLTDEQKELLNDIDAYQVYAYETIDRMKPIDADLLATQQMLKQKDIDLVTINTHIKTIRNLNKTWKEELKESMLLHKDSWLNTTLAQFVKVIEETYKTVSAKEKELFDVLITNTKQFIAQNPVDPEEVSKKERALDILRKQYVTERDEAAPSKDAARIEILNRKIKVIDPLQDQLLDIAEKLDEKLQKEEELGRKNREEELAFIQQESAMLEKEGTYKPQDVTLSENPLLRALDTRKIPLSTGYEKVKTDAEEGTQRLLDIGEQRRQQEAFEAQQKREDILFQKNRNQEDL